MKSKEQNEPEFHPTIMKHFCLVLTIADIKVGKDIIPVTKFCLKIEELQV